MTMQSDVQSIAARELPRGEEYNSQSRAILSLERQKELSESTLFRIRQKFLNGPPFPKIEAQDLHRIDPVPSWARNGNRPESYSEYIPQDCSNCGYPSTAADSEDEGEMDKSKRELEKSLRKFGSFMNECQGGIADDSQTMCAQLLSIPQPVPKEGFFQPEGLEQFEELLKMKSEAIVQRDMTPLIIPSLCYLIMGGAEHFSRMAEAMSDLWLPHVAIDERRPKPDYSLGFHSSAFTAEQRKTLTGHPALQNPLIHGSYAVPSSTTILPFFTCEVKCCGEDMTVADRQNTLSATIGLQGLVVLFRAVNRENELHRRILYFSISHNDQEVYVYGHYPVINGESTGYYRHTVFRYRIFEDGGEQRWMAYKFVRSLQDVFAPRLHVLICSAIDHLAQNQ